MNGDVLRLSFSQAPRDCFTALTDRSNWTRWRPGLRQVDAPAGPPDSGDAWVETHALGGTLERFSARVIEVETPRAFAYTLECPRMQALFRWTLQDRGERTVILQETRARNRGFGPMLAGLASRFVDQQDAALQALKTHLDERAQVLKGAA